MNKNEQIKICRICGTTAKNDGVVFEKHRKVCRECRSKYHKNRREDLEDGKRDSANWYKAEDELSNAHTIKKLEKIYNGKTAVLQIPEHVLKDTVYDSSKESRHVAYVFFFVFFIITWICIGAVYPQLDPFKIIGGYFA